MEAANVYDIQSKQHSQSAEFRIIGGCLIWGIDEYKKAAEILNDIDFYDGKARKMWKLIHEIAVSGSPLDIGSFLEYAEKRNLIDTFGGRAGIVKTANYTPTETQFISYIQEVKKLSLTRQRIAELRQELEDLETGKKVIESPNSRIKVMTDQEIFNLELPSMNWVIPGLIGEGLTILAGKPKLGKSWLALAISLGISNGGYVLGKIAVQKYGVLYLALEDTARRMQDRIRQLNVKPSGNLKISFEWNRGESGAADLDKFLTNNPETKLVFIDTLAKIKAVTNSRRNVYEIDYETIGTLKQIADRHRAAVVVVHHVRKGESDDPLEMVSGSTGLSGAADTILVLNRGRGQVDATLFVTGRDVNEDELALQKDVNAGWVLLGDAKEYQQSKDRREIINLLSGKDGLSPKEISESIGKNLNNTRVILHRMENDALITKVSYGKYILK